MPLVTKQDYSLFVKTSIFQLFILLLLQHAAGQTKHPAIMLDEVVVVGTAKMATRTNTHPNPFPVAPVKTDWSGYVVDAVAGISLPGVIIRLSYGDSWQYIQSDQEGKFAVTQRRKFYWCGFSETEQILQISFIHPFYDTRMISFSQFEETIRSGQPFKLVKRHAPEQLSQLLGANRLL